MNTIQKFAYFAIGGLLVATGMIISPINAQKDKFGEIECTKLTVTDDDGTPKVILVAGDYYDPLTDENAAILIHADDFYRTVSVRNTHKEGERLRSAQLTAFGRIVGAAIDGNNGDASVEISSGEFGGRVTIINNEGEIVGRLGANPDGGGVDINNNEGQSVGTFQAFCEGGACNVLGKDGESMAGLGISERGGGLVAVRDKDGNYVAGLGGPSEHGGYVEARGKDGKSKAILFIDEHGGSTGAIGKDLKSSVLIRIDEDGGRVAAYSNEGKSAASLGVTEHGGHIQVKGKSEGLAVMAINKYGNGGVSTWDKNGYRQ